ncbi:SymE family type I addiction module toxin [Lelliottia sp. JS-SCA-14]|uniref:SymE family type I addiction module toxin n=1 Tax=Lelliottia sp. JS-SCA-14 TaxID=3110110 RepID=UPI002D77D2FE|nr:SymE family type I addiction module toxin [Lelliottia sp. JS-SCA-14]
MEYISRNREAVRNNGARRLHKENAIPQVEEKAERVSKTLRRMTICYVNIRHFDRKTKKIRRYTRSASLLLNGHWMEEAGFTTGTPLDVRVIPGCLVITKLLKDPPCP